MPAPLHNRYRRNFERDSKVLRVVKKHTQLVQLAQLHKVKSRVYSLSERASAEMGHFSVLPVDKLLSVLEDLQLPDERVWVEFNHVEAYRAVTGDMSFGRNDPEVPVRSAFLFQMDAGKILAFAYYLFGTGKTMFCPAAIEINVDPEGAPPRREPSLAAAQQQVTGFTPEQFALGLDYWNRENKERPRLTRKLADRVHQYQLLPIGFGHDQARLVATQTHGFARMAFAALCTACYAQRKTYYRDSDGEEVSRDPRPSELLGPQHVVEVDVFVKPEAVPGRTILRGVREYAKKRRHKVKGHWVYRARKDGLDPRTCHNAPNGQHMWEAIEDTARQCCLRCDQVRWYKKPHERGEGEIAPTPIYNVRMG